MAVDRRGFLQMSTLAGVSFFVPRCLFAACREIFSSKKLVVLQLTGGNDGLNTIIPFRNDIYYRSRPTIAVPPNKVLTLTDESGLHPSLKNIYALYQERAISLIQNVGYPQPHRSHQNCLDVWHSGDRKMCNTGWLGRYNDYDKNAKTFCAGPDYCLALKRERTGQMNAGSPSQVPLTAKLRAIAAMMQCDPDGHNVFYLSHLGYDTHVGQTETHARLLSELDEAVGGFVRQLKENDQFKDVLILTISEFGRRVAENEFGGTDHGTANCIMAISGRLKNAGLCGTAPVLSDMDDGDLKHSIDFRQVYATVLDHWLSTDAASILNDQFTPLDFV